tara:strand:- start:7458 stop:8252 length:795 start_codon:yes stop_codon:yes gene_type:complete
MALVLKDRVKETTATTGTGALSLAGAVTNFQSFSSVLSDTDTTYYAVIDVTNSEFEIGLGTYSSGGNTLARTTVLESSNGGSAVNFSAGTKNVFIAYPAEKSAYLDASGQLVINGTAITATPAELNYLDITTPGTTQASAAVTSDSDGVVTFADGISEKLETLSGTTPTVDLHTSTNFTHTLSGNTSYTFSNPAATNSVSALTLKVVQDASASGYTITWPASVDWPNATAPTLTATASAVDMFVFITNDNGTTYYGFAAGQALG